MFAIYKNNPTAGAQDGSKVSEGDGSNPIMIGALDAATNEVSNAITLAIRCDEGFANVDSNAVISLSGTNASLWSLSLDNQSWSEWGGSITLASLVGTTNTLFYARAKSVDTEIPQSDLTVKLNVKMKVGAV